ncbi:MAG: flagellar basal body P-ring formation chaperone FlgA [Sulfurimonas sp.]|nr:flagellar basal body P-ring formation chaperone FlgA [Sulfurimonas sp.]
MILLKIILLSLLAFNLFANTLIKEAYFINTNNIGSKILFPNTKNNIILFQIPDRKNSIRIKNKQLTKILKENGYKDFQINSRYIHFKKISPIDTTKIENFLNKHYLEMYANINIKSIKVTPRSYLEELPSSFSIHIRTKSYLSKNGVISIKDTKNKKIFFNYVIDADLKIVKAKTNIKKGDEFSVLNVKLYKIKLDKFHAKPLQKIEKSKYQAKNHIKVDKIVSIRNIVPLSLVRKGSMVSVFMYSAGINISFVAKALQNGKLNDIISIKKGNNKKKLKAKVVGYQRVEIR